ncbi:hypothetical protein [Streptomyces sp. NPDC013455]|uniref:hypothetical protein n=1 Tax=Streptomyces sp. NPDC013455 TaxID=3155605 RepID=UPI0033C5AA19
MGRRRGPRRGASFLMLGLALPATVTVTGCDGPGGSADGAHPAPSARSAHTTPTAPATAPTPVTQSTRSTRATHSAPGLASPPPASPAVPPAASPSRPSPAELCTRLVVSWSREVLDGDTYGDYQSMGLSGGQYEILRAVVTAARVAERRQGEAAARKLIDRQARRACAERYRDGTPGERPWS